MTATDALALAVERKLQTRVRPLLQIHGGEVTLLSVDDGHVHVRFEGACVGCPLRPVTLSLTIERELGAVEGVESVSAAGVRVAPQAAARMRAAFAGHLAPPAAGSAPPGPSRQGAGNG
jgi:Fe-S cluster biogenesis protein NfuA